MDSKIKIDFTKGSLARAKINAEFYLPKWESFRDWYFKSFSEEEFEYIVSEFYKYWENQNKLIHFVPWFFKTFIIDYISILKRNYKLSSGQIQKYVYPPQQSFIIEKNNKILNFTAFSKLFDNDMLQITVTHINQIIEKQNYTNLYLTIIGEEINSLKDRIDKIILAINQIKPDVHIQEPETNIVSIVTSSIQSPPDIKYLGESHVRPSHGS